MIDEETLLRGLQEALEADEIKFLVKKGI